MNSDADRPIKRVRYEGARRRTLNVLAVTQLTPNMVRVSLGGDLDGFESQGFDDHVKLFFPPAQPGAAPAMRDFTPVEFNRGGGALELEFALHDDGPAANWARAARVGQSLEIGGPRGSMVIPTTFQNHVLIGDDTALPAIKRRLRELPAGASALAIIEVQSPADEQALSSSATLTTRWVHRGAGAASGLPAALRAATVPHADVFAWAAAEADLAKALRLILIDEKHIAKTHVKASGYWRRGAVAVHEKFDD